MNMKSMLMMAVIAWLPLAGGCADIEAAKSVRTAAQAQVELSRAIKDVSGTYHAIEVKGFSVKIAPAQVYSFPGDVLVFMRPEGKEGWIVGGYNCDGRSRSNGMHIVMTCDSDVSDPNNPGSFFSIQKMSLSPLKSSETGKIEFKLDHNEASTYLLAYHDKKSGSRIYMMLQKE